jgi:ATP-dependent helicase/nuclease subunit B
MKKLYYDSFNSNRRTELVKECVRYINNGSKVFYILPSREAMFDVRRLFTKELGGIFGFHVFGFDDLEKLILGKSINDAKIISDLQERMILKHVLKELSEDTLFDKVKSKPGFLDLLIHTIRKLKRLHVSPEEFLSRTAELKGNLLKKCEGFQSIYSGYEKIKAERGLIDIDDISMKAVKACPNTKLFENTAIIVVDGFINIDPVNIKLLNTIQQEYPDISIYANIPFRNRNNEQFLMDEVIKDLKQMGFETIEHDCSVGISVNPCFQSLAHHIYSGDGNIKADVNNLRILNSPCMDYEIRITAGKAKELIQDHGVKPSDIAVICTDMENYKPRVIPIFEEYGVHISVKGKNKLLSIPVIKDSMALWRLGLYKEYSAALISIVTSKYLLPVEVRSDGGFETDKLYKLSERILKNDVQGNRFEAFLDEYIKNTENESSKEAMKRYIEAVCIFEKALGGQPLDTLRAFLEFLDTVQIDRNISLLYSEGLLNEKLWLRDIEALIELSEFFNQLNQGYKEYSFRQTDIELESLIKDIFDMIAGAETEDITRDTSGVRFILPDLVRGQTYDTVFILGANEGSFPVAGNKAELFYVNEMNELSKIGIELSTSEWELEREKLRFNACMASARNRLYISYRTADEDGGVMIASPFIDEVVSILDKESKEKVFEKPISMRDRVSYKNNPCSTSEVVKRTSTLSRNSIPFEKGIISREVQERLQYPLHVSTMEFSRELGSGFNAYDGKLENPVLAQQDASYGFSASQLNSYSRCPFTYFAQRVLDLTVEDDNIKEMLDTGTFYHAVLHAYHLGNQKPCEPNIKRLNSIFNEMSGQLTFDSVPVPLKKLILEELLMVLRNFIIHDAENMSRYYQTTGYTLKPVMLEEPFKMTIGKGRNILKGVADRVDLEVNERGSYTGRFIIYDYKKGSIKSIKECIEGDDFQLPLYYAAFKNIIKEKFNIEQPECLALLYYSIEKLDWNGIIRKDIKRALFEGRKGTKSTPDKANMEVVLTWAGNEAVNVIDSIRKGYFMPPKDCPASSMFGCLYSGICRYDRTRLAQKEGVL